MFPTRLREAHKDGINFAGHFIFTYWGCGTGCVQGAIIDAITGKVYFPKEFAGIGFPMGIDIPDEPLEYRKDSKLFVLHGNAATNEDPGVSYFHWEGTKLRAHKICPIQELKLLKNSKP